VRSSPGRDVERKASSPGGCAPRRSSGSRTGSCTARSTGSGNCPVWLRPRLQCSGSPSPLSLEPAALAYLLGAVALLAAVLSLGLPWLAAKEVRAAAGEWRRSPDRAFERLERARRLDPLSDRPDLIAGAIASRLGDTRRMVEEFGNALERNPSNWYARLELGVAYAREGKRAAALQELSAARRLNPREPTIVAVASKVRRGETVSLAELDRNFLRRTFVSNRKT
jgi:tetratricopeptide (TPR) repeat protein